MTDPRARARFSRPHSRHPSLLYSRWPPPSRGYPVVRGSGIADARCIFCLFGPLRVSQGVAPLCIIKYYFTAPRLALDARLSMDVASQQRLNTASASGAAASSCPVPLATGRRWSPVPLNTVGPCCSLFVDGAGLFLVVLTKRWRRCRLTPSCEMRCRRSVLEYVEASGGICRVTVYSTYVRTCPRPPSLENSHAGRTC